MSENSSEGLKSCKRTRKTSGMICKDRALSNKYKRYEDSAYDVTLSTAVIHTRYSTKIRLENKPVESCRAIGEDINNKYLPRYD